MLETLKMSDESRSLFERPWLTLESESYIPAPVLLAPIPLIVLVYRVGLRGAELLATAPAVVKFSKREHSILLSSVIQLCTLEYHRNQYGGEIRGVRDPNEGRYTSKKSLGHPISATARITYEANYEVNDDWIFCTAILPTMAVTRKTTVDLFAGYDAATKIDDPPEFAKQLGLIFGNYSSDANVSLSSAEENIRLLTSLPVNRVVHVYHGPVVYTDDTSTIIESYPVHDRGCLLPFFKRHQFAHQREYRFSISLRGTPITHKLRLPISSELRDSVKNIPI